MDLRDVKKALAGSEHCLALDEQTGAVYSWGWNEHGMCGDARIIDVRVPKKVDTRLGGKPVLIGSGAGHCLALCE